MKYYKFELNMLIANIVSLLLFIVGFCILILTYGYINNSVGLLLIEFVIYMIIHEIIHGLAFSLFCKNKGNVKYGAMLEKGVIYSMCQERISRKGALISLLAPTVVLTIIAFIIALIFRIDDLAILSIFNLSGAAGDLLMTYFLLRLPKDVQYIDYDNVIGFYLISKEDLSKYKSKIVKFVESGKDSDKLINKSIKPIDISKPSWVIFVIFIIICILLNVLPLF